MKKISIGIVDDNKDFCDVVRNYIKKEKNMKVLFIANDGLEAMEYLNSELECPDVLILDLIMPHLDGLGVLESLNSIKLDKYPRVIITSAIRQDSMIQKSTSLGAQYYLVKPVNLSLLIKRINQLNLPLTEEVSKDDANSNLQKSLVMKDSLLNRDLDMNINNFLHEVSVPKHVKGHQFLRDAIALVVNNTDLLSAITKELYPTVADMNNTTPSRVERAIRHAIELTWSRGDLVTLDYIFKGAIKKGTYKPTNSEFIAVIADKLRIERALV